jgi:hypothetical protein
MKAEDEVVTSPLSRTLDIGDQHLMINVFKGALADDEWLFEVVDSQGHADISHEMYPTDQAALNAALQTIHVR